LKQNNISVERYIDHFKVSNQQYLKLNKDPYFKSINSIDTKISIKSTLFCFLYFSLIFISVYTWRGVATGLKRGLKIHKDLKISDNSSKILKIHEQF
jgi:hypothetical protein